MRPIRLFTVIGGQSVLVLDMPRRQGLSEARVVVKASTRSRTHNFYFNEPAECAAFVQSFDQRQAGFAVARLLSQKGEARAQ